MTTVEPGRCSSLPVPSLGTLCIPCKYIYYIIFKYEIHSTEHRPIERENKYERKSSIFLNEIHIFQDGKAINHWPKYRYIFTVTTGALLGIVFRSCVQLKLKLLMLQNKENFFGYWCDSALRVHYCTEDFWLLRPPMQGAPPRFEPGAFLTAGRRGYK
jgi:hypothetical protein